MVKKERSDLKLRGMIMMQCSKESMNYWDKLEPTDENVSRLVYFRCKSELLPYIRMGEYRRKEIFLI